ARLMWRLCAPLATIDDRLRRDPCECYGASGRDDVLEDVLTLVASCRAQRRPLSGFPVALDQPSERAALRAFCPHRRLFGDGSAIFRSELGGAEGGTQSAPRAFCPADSDIPDNLAVPRHLAMQM